MLAARPRTPAPSSSSRRRARKTAPSQRCRRRTEKSKLPFYGAVGGHLVNAAQRTYQIDKSVLEKPMLTEAEQKSWIVPGLRAGYYLCFFGMHVLTPAVQEILAESLAGGAQARKLNQLSPGAGEAGIEGAIPCGGYSQDEGMTSASFGLLTSQLRPRPGAGSPGRRAGGGPGRATASRGAALGGGRTRAERARPALLAARCVDAAGCRGGSAALARPGVPGAHEGRRGAHAGDPQRGLRARLPRQGGHAGPARRTRPPAGDGRRPARPRCAARTPLQRRTMERCGAWRRS